MVCVPALMEAACGGRGGEAGQELTDTLSLTGPQFVLVELFRVETKSGDQVSLELQSRQGSWIWALNWCLINGGWHSQSERAQK